MRLILGTKKTGKKTRQERPSPGSIAYKNPICPQSIGMLQYSNFQVFLNLLYLSAWLQVGKYVNPKILIEFKFRRSTDIPQLLELYIITSGKLYMPISHT